MSNDLSSLLDWQDIVHVEPGILRTKSKRLQMTYRLVHRDTEQMDCDQRAWHLSRMDEVFKLVNAGFAMEADWRHEPDTSYPDTDWETGDVAPATKLVDAMRRITHESQPGHISTLDMTLSWAPPTRKARWFRNFLMTRGTRREMERCANEEIERFLEGHERFVGALSPLVETLEPLDKDGLCTYLHRAISWDEHAVTCPDYLCDIDRQLTSETWVPGRPPRLGDQLVQPITIKTWQKKLRTYLPEALSKVPFPCRYHVRWEPMDAQSAEKYLTDEERKRAVSYTGMRKLAKQSTDADQEEEVQGRDRQDTAIEAGQSIVDVRARVRQGLSVLGWLKPTVLCWAPDKLTLAERVKTINNVLFQQGLVARKEEPNASIEWLACLPGHVKYGIRAVALETEFLTALVPHAQMWHGQMWNHHLGGPCLEMLTTDGAPFGYSTHVGQLGHVLYVGPTRSGKSAKLALDIVSWFRYPRARACVWDRDRSLKAMTLFHGGHHYELGAPGGPRLQILGDLDTEEGKQWAALWIENVLSGEGLPPDPDERREIWLMIQRLAGLPRQHRTLTMARIQLQSTRLKVGLEPFCAGGEYEFCDGDADGFAWNSRLLCFEMGHLIEKPRALYAVLAYGFHKLETQWFNGDPVVVAIDEAQWLMNLELFLGQLDVWLLARAKKNVSVWLSLQNIEYLERTALWQSMINNVPTKMVLPNPNAIREKVRPYYEALGLPGWAIEQVAMAEPFRDYLYSSPLGTRMTQCTLEPVVRLLCAASSMEELAVLDRMMDTTAWEDLPAAWLTYWQWPDEARFLAPQGGKSWSATSLPASSVSSLVSV